MPVDSKRAVFGWAMYDWANSAFATTIMAGFFPLFFKQYWSAGVEVTTSTARLGLANSVSGLAVALVAPVLGAMADKGGAKKKFLIFFAYTGAVMTSALFLISKGQWGLAFLVYLLANVGFSGGNIFYDSLLTGVTNEKRVDVISAWGFALGYLGGGLLFAFNVWMTLKPESFSMCAGLPRPPTGTLPRRVLTSMS